MNDAELHYTAWWRRPPRLFWLLLPAIATLTVVALVARGPDTDLPKAPDLDLFSGLNVGTFRVEAAQPPNPDLTTELLAIDPETGAVAWTALLPPGVRDLGFSDGVISFTYSGQWGGTSGLGALTEAGEPLWQLENPRETHYQSLLLDDGDALVSTGARTGIPGVELVRVDARSGEVVWHTELDHALSRQTTIGDRLVAFQEGQGLIGIDLLSGDVLWRTRPEGNQWTLGAAERFTFDTRNSDTAFFGLLNGKQRTVVGVNIDGEIVTDVDVDSQATVASVTDRYLIVDSGFMVVRYSLSGDVEWRRSGSLTWEFQSIGDIAPIYDGSGLAVVGIDLPTGEDVWRTKEVSDVRAMTAATDTFYFMGSWNTEPRIGLWAVDSDSGATRWDETFRGLYRQAPLVTESHVIVGAAGTYIVPGRPKFRDEAPGNFRAYTTQGEPAWSVDLNGGFDGMELHDDVLYVISYPNRSGL